VQSKRQELKLRSVQLGSKKHIPATEILCDTNTDWLSRKNRWKMPTGTTETGPIDTPLEVQRKTFQGSEAKQEQPQ